MTGQGFTVAVSVLLRPVAPPEVASATIVTAPVEPYGRSMVPFHPLRVRLRTIATEPEVVPAIHRSVTDVGIPPEVIVAANAVLAHAPPPAARADRADGPLSRNVGGADVVVVVDAGADVVVVGTDVVDVDARGTVVGGATTRVDVGRSTVVGAAVSTTSGKGSFCLSMNALWLSASCVVPSGLFDGRLIRLRDAHRADGSAPSSTEGEAGGTPQVRPLRRRSVVGQS